MAAVILNICSVCPAKPEWIQKPVDSQLEEGRAGYLQCHARATPEPEVTWYRNMQPISAEVSGTVMSCRYHIRNTISNRVLRREAPFDVSENDEVVIFLLGKDDPLLHIQ